MNYYISDLHFNCCHSFDNRTLATDDFIIKNWNSRIHQKDNVYILGDIGKTGGNKNNEYLCQKLSVLKGNKILIVGNHDDLKDSRISQQFSEITYYKEISDNFNGASHKLVLSHYPIFVWNGSYNNTILLYGHCHNNFDDKLFQESLKKLRNVISTDEEVKKRNLHLPYAYNVGAMCSYINYCPRTLKEIETACRK